MAEQEVYGGNYGGDGTKPGKYAKGLKIGHLQQTQHKYTKTKTRQNTKTDPYIAKAAFQLSI